MKVNYNKKLISSLVVVLVVTAVIAFRGKLEDLLELLSPPAIDQQAAKRDTSRTKQNSETIKIKTTCFSKENSFFTDMLSIFQKSTLKVLVTENSDLFLSKADFVKKMSDPNTNLARLGLFGEDLLPLEKALDSLTNCGKEKRDELELKIIKNKHHDGTLVNIFFILKLKTQDKISAVLKQNGLPYFAWKRLHLRLYHQRGHEGFRYRWTGRENDDDGNFKIPAEAFEGMEDAVPIDPADPFVVAPKDKDFFVWQKKGAEFKECNQENLQQTQTHSKGKVLTDKKAIEFYMKSIMTIKHLMGRFRIFSWLNCGTLLGWWRQCSLLPGDSDIDLLHWNSMDFYPGIIKEFLDHPKIFTIKKMTLDFGPFKKLQGTQEGVYIKVGVAGGQTVDVYFNYERKVYDTRFQTGKVYDSFEFTDNVCSADLHGYLVHVPCTDAKIHGYNVLYFGKDYMTPKHWW